MFHLTLKGKWYDLIAQGKKKTEYRKDSCYYSKMIFAELRKAREENRNPQVCLHRGYTKTTMIYTVGNIIGNKKGIIEIPLMERLK